MKVAILNSRKNSFLKREEMDFEASDFNITPTRKELREKISLETNAKPENIAIGKTRQLYGSKSVIGKANVYGSRQELENTEQEFVLARTEGKKAKQEGQEKQEQKSKE